MQTKIINPINGLGPLQQHKVWLWGLHPVTCWLDREVHATLQDHHWPTAIPVMLDDVTGSRTFATAFPVCDMCSERTFSICEENRAPISLMPSKQMDGLTSLKFTWQLSVPLFFYQQWFTVDFHMFFICGWCSYSMATFYTAPLLLNLTLELSKT